MSQFYSRTTICLLEEMVELGNAAWRPLETAISVAQVAHDVTVFPTATLSSGATEVTGWRRAVVNRAQAVGSKEMKSIRNEKRIYKMNCKLLMVLTDGRLRERRR